MKRIQLVRVFLLAFFLLLSACTRQPEQDRLQQDLDKLLTETFGQGQFEIVRLNRTGSAVDQTAPAGDSRRIVYYSVELKVLKDLVLGDWDQPGAATLVNILGAGPRSITGVQLQGNKVGSIIRAQASAVYKEQADQWVRLSSGDYQVAKAPVVESGAFPSATQQQLKSLTELVNGLPRSELSPEQQMVQHELMLAVASMQGYKDQLNGLAPIASGLEQGEYFALAQALSLSTQKAALPMSTLVTAGSVDNIALLRSGAAQLAFVQADIAQMAYEGTGAFSVTGSFKGLRTLGGLYPEVVHLVASNQSGVNTIEDLRGKRIVIGRVGSAIRTTLEAVLAAHGLQAGRDYEAMDVGFDTGLQLLEQGKVTAVAHVIGIPANPFRTLLLNSKYHLLSFEPAVIEQLVQQYAAMVALSLPADTYPLQKHEITTIAIPALLLVRSDMSEEKAQTLANEVFAGHYDLLAKGSAQGTQINWKTAKLGLVVPVHPGVLKLLESSSPKVKK